MQALLKRISVVAVLFLFAANLALHAQDNAGITGTVSDKSGAVLTGATVTLTNPSRGLSFTATTNSDGAYRFPNVPPAPGYLASFSHTGFSSLDIKDITLLVGTTRTQDAKLAVGHNVTVEVTAQNSLITLNTTDASIGNNFDPEIINELPIANRNSVAALFTLQAGVTSQGSVTGSRTDQTSVTVDGMDVNDISTGQFGNINGGMPVDATQEFRGSVAGLPANLGTGGGGQFQLVTKSGTNKFHGDINEYHRDTVTSANTWFNNNTLPQVPRTALIRNQFGGALGGPLWRDKLYFFVDFNNSRIVSSLAGTDTVPLDSYRAGNIGYVKTGCATTSRQTTSPACIGFLTPADVKAKDPAGIGENATMFSLLNSRYPHANDLSGGDGVNTGLFRFTQSTLNVLYNGVARVDYNLSSTQRIFLQYHDAHQDSVQAINRFPGDPLTRPFQDRSYGYVASHIWEIGANKVNQFYFGDNVTIFSFGLAYNPLGANIVGGTTIGGILTGPYDGSNIQRRRVPIPTVRDDFNWTKGAHNIGIGGSFKYIKASNFLGSDYNTYTIGLGGNVTTLNGTTLRPTDIQGTGTTNTTQYDNAFALALGRVGRISSIYNFDASGKQQPSGTGANRRFRYYQTELYVADTWKVTRQLTLNYGLRYSLYSVPFETLGAESAPSVGFDEYIAARVKQSAAGISGATSVPLLSYNLVGRVNNAPDYYNSNPKDFAPRIGFAYNPSPKTVFNGSADLVYDRTVANAVNFLQNQSTFLFQNTAALSYGSSADPSGSLKNDPRVSDFSNLPAPPIVPSPTRPFTPFVNAAGVPTGLASQNTTYVIDKNLKDPYSIAVNFGIQQEFPGQLVLKASYAGRMGRRLLGQADASQLIDFPDNASGQMLSQAFAYVTTRLRAGATPNSMVAQPFFEHILTPNFYVGRACGSVTCNSNTAYVASNQGPNVFNGDITDALQAFASAGILPTNVGLASQFARDTYYTNKGFSNYNGLLLTVSKNMSHGTKFDFNYTWSHSIDNVSIIANAVASGTGFICDVMHPRACRGNSDFDVTHVITSDILLQMPFGRGREFGSNAPRLLDEVIGGWEFSAIPTWQSGFALTTSSGAFLAGFANNVPAIYDGLGSDDVAMHLHKNASNQLVAFKDPAAALKHFRGPIGIEYGSRNPLRGPSQLYLDAGLSKTFRILPEDRLNLRFRADSFNVLNHPTFSTPNTSYISSSFGIVSAQTGTTARVGQFSLRLEF
ncbi:MAG TPA: TonB-dependent receptor [Acidobacteriaceae bacterium]